MEEDTFNDRNNHFHMAKVVSESPLKNFYDFKRIPKIRLAGGRFQVCITELVGGA